MDENFMCRCIPYRYSETEANKSVELEVLVISSQKGEGMLFPKVLFALACRMWLFYFLVLVNPLVILQYSLNVLYHYREDGKWMRIRKLLP